MTKKEKIRFLLNLHEEIGQIPVPQTIETATPHDAWQLGVSTAQLLIQSKIMKAEDDKGTT